MKKFLFLLLMVGALLLLCVSLAAAEKALRGYDRQDKYQFVQMGTYPYEEDNTPKPVLWRVLSVENDQALLLTEYVLDTKQVIFETDPQIIEKHSFRRIGTYADSDLYDWLNTEGIDVLFGNDPLRAALMQDPDLGYLYPLTRDQYLKPELGFSPNPWGEEINAHPDRQAVSTPYARAKKLFVNASNNKSPYWCVAIKSPKDYKFGLVGFNGHISWGAYTNIKVGGLRLCVRLDLQKVSVTSGEGTAEVPYLLSYIGAEEPILSLVTSESIDEENDPDGKHTPPNDMETLTETPFASREESALISLLGDCSIGDALNSIKMNNSYHTVVRENGYAWPFSQVCNILSADDLTVANLEVVFTERSNHKNIKYPLRALPEHVQILKEGSVELVNTVNNHSYDYGRDGYVDTLNTLNEAGISHFGSLLYGKENGFDDVEVVDINGIRFGFFGISYPQEYDLKHIDQLLSSLREESHCDVVIASMHWGREGFTEADKLTSVQINLSKRLIENGADVVYGHHPHVLQPLVFYKNKPILFSTGNFTFGTISRDLDSHSGIFQLFYERTDSGVLLRKLQVIPCQTGKKGDYRPAVLDDSKEIEKTYRILSPNRRISSFTRAPESFLTTGTVLFDDTGEMVVDP